LCEELVLQSAEHGELLSSALVQFEAHEVFKRKFPHVPQACALFDASWRIAQLINDVAEPANDNDRRLVTAASIAGADLFVTGDKRVLGWKQVQSSTSTLRIVSPREAWGLLAGGPGNH
jgi:hypothetical protein